ncbi:MAG: hypothetical protein WCI45_09395 [Desulfuromonadales bacterium]
MATIVFTCPQCGGPFECAEGDRGAVCGFCGVTSVISGDIGVSRLLVRERIDLNSARTAVRKLLAVGENGRASAAPFGFQGGELLFLPFWRICGMAMGWRWCEKEVFREEADYDEHGARYTRTIKGLNERSFSLVARVVDFSSSAGDYTAFGPMRVGLATAVLKCEVLDYPETATRGTIVDPLKGVAQARREALAFAQGGNANGTVRQESRVRISSEWAAMTYYPVWRLFFTRGARVYPVIVDAVNGDVVKCRFPGEEQTKKLLPLALIALVVLGWTTMPLAGLAATIFAAFVLKWRTGSLDISTIITQLAGTSERNAGVQRG